MHMKVISSFSIEELHAHPMREELTAILAREVGDILERPTRSTGHWQVFAVVLCIAALSSAVLHWTGFSEKLDFTAAVIAARSY